MSSQNKTAPSPEEGRNPKPCPQYRKCGGCQLQNMTYERQLAWKQARVEMLLKQFHAVSPILPMKNPYHYRNKVQAAFTVDRYRKTVSGVYQSSTRQVVPVDHCMIEDQTADAIIVTIRNLMKDFKMSPYDLRTGSGFLRHVLIRRGFASGQVMVVLVTATPVFPARNNFVKALRKKHPEITTILYTVHTGGTDLLLGETERLLYGPGYIEDTLCGCVFRISAKSFYQINPVQTELLYQTAIDFAGLTGAETVIDAYCGIGTIGLAASKGAKMVYGVEQNRDAVRDAIANAKCNKIENVWFTRADAGEYMTALAEEGKSADVVFMDPPRAGSSVPFLEALCRLSPERVVYISCNPETLARDLEFLTKQNYHVQKLQPVDMFPFTNHVECVALITRK